MFFCVGLCFEAVIWYGFDGNKAVGVVVVVVVGVVVAGGGGGGVVVGGNTDGKCVVLNLKLAFADDGGGSLKVFTTKFRCWCCYCCCCCCCCCC